MDATGHVIEEGSRYAVREDRFGGKAKLWITTQGGEKRKEVVDLMSQTDVGEVSDMYPGYKMSTRRYANSQMSKLLHYQGSTSLNHISLLDLWTGSMKK
jgi:hypothetical protein